MRCCILSLFEQIINFCVGSGALSLADISPDILFLCSILFVVLCIYAIMAVGRFFMNLGRSI